MSYSAAANICDADEDCSGHGRCTDTVCYCDTGWFGLACGSPSCMALSQSQNVYGSISSQAPGLPLPPALECEWRLNSEPLDEGIRILLRTLKPLHPPMITFV